MARTERSTITCEPLHAGKCTALPVLASGSTSTSISSIEMSSDVAPSAVRKARRLVTWRTNDGRCGWVHAAAALRFGSWLEPELNELRRDDDDDDDRAGEERPSLEPHTDRGGVGRPPAGGEEGRDAGPGPRWQQHVSCVCASASAMARTDASNACTSASIVAGRMCGLSISSPSAVRRPCVTASTYAGSFSTSTASAVHAASTAATQSVSVPSCGTLSVKSTGCGRRDGVPY